MVGTSRGNYSDYREAALQAKLWTAQAQPGYSYYIAVCDPLTAGGSPTPPDEYIPA